MIIGPGGLCHVAASACHFAWIADEIGTDDIVCTLCKISQLIISVPVEVSFLSFWLGSWNSPLSSKDDVSHEQVPSLPRCLRPQASGCMGEQQKERYIMSINLDAHYMYPSWTPLSPMSPTKQGKATRKPIVEPKRPIASPKTSKRALITNLGLVTSNALLSIAEYAPLPGIKHAAQAATFFFSTIDVCGHSLQSLCYWNLSKHHSFSFFLESSSEQRGLPDHRWWCRKAYRLYMALSREIWKSEKVGESWD